MNQNRRHVHVKHKSLREGEKSEKLLLITLRNDERNECLSFDNVVQKTFYVLFKYFAWYFLLNIAHTLKIDVQRPSAFIELSKEIARNINKRPRVETKQRRVYASSMMYNDMKRSLDSYALSGH